MEKTATEHLTVDITPAVMALPTPGTGTLELGRTGPETTVITVVDDPLHPEGPQERDTQTEIAMTTDHPVMAVEAEAKVRNETGCHIMVGHQVGK